MGHGVARYIDHDWIERLVSRVVRGVPREVGVSCRNVKGVYMDRTDRHTEMYAAEERGLVQSEWKKHTFIRGTGGFCRF